MANILIVAVGLPLGIILISIFASKYPDRLQSWMPWVYGIWALTTLPRIYQGISSGRYGLGFWLAIVMLLLIVPMFVSHLRQRDGKKQDRENTGAA